MLCYYLAGAIGGAIADRRGARPVVAFGALALPSGLALASLAPSLPWLFAAYVPLVGLAVGSCYAPFIGAVGRAFDRGRGLAIGVVLTGVGGGTLALPLIMRALLDRLGWRPTLRVLAVAALVVMATAAVLVIDHGRPAGKRSRRILAAMAASASFRRLYASVVLIAPGFYAPLAFLNDSAIGRGVTSATAAGLVASIGLGSVATRLGFGALAPRVGPLVQYAGSHVLFVVALGCWLVAGDRLALLALSALLHGVAWAAWVTAAPLVLADWFGVDDLGAAVGGFYTGLGLGALFGPPLTAAIIESQGEAPAIVVVMATSVASLMLVGSVARGRPVSSPRR